MSIPPEDYYFVDGVSADGYVVGQNGTEYLGDDDVAPVITVSSSHYFDKVDGHTAYASWTKEVPVSDAVGYYQAFTTYVRKITKAGRQDGDIINDWYIEYEIVAIADVQLCPATYAEGYIDYGVVYIQGGEAPDGGEIVDGSFAGDRYNYCVVLEDGEYYWYNKIT